MKRVKQPNPSRKLPPQNISSEIKKSMKQRERVIDRAWMLKVTVCMCDEKKRTEVLCKQAFQRGGGVLQPQRRLTERSRLSVPSLLWSEIACLFNGLNDIGWLILSVSIEVPSIEVLLFTRSDKMCNKTWERNTAKLTHHVYLRNNYWTCMNTRHETQVNLNPTMRKTKYKTNS